MSGRSIGKFFRRQQGETISEMFPIRDKDGNALPIHTDWAKSIEEYANGVLKDTPLMTQLSVASPSQQMTLTMSQAVSASADIGFHYGQLIIVGGGEERYSVQYVIEIYENERIEVPINPVQMVQDLELPEDFSMRRMDRAIMRARDRANYLVPDSVRVWSNSNGWTRSIASWTQELANLYLSQKIYVGREEEFRDEIRQVESMLENSVVDGNRDGDLTDEEDASGGTSFSINRVSV